MSALLLHAQVPLEVDQLETGKSGDSIALDWRIDAADRALRSGLVGLAESSYRSVLENPSLPLGREDPIRVRLASTLIAQRNFLEASEVLDLVSERGQNGQYHLYRAIASYGGGKDIRRSRFVESMKQVNPSQLDAFDRPWWHLVRGLRAELQEKPEEVMAAFQVAADVASTDAQKAFFESLVYRQKLLQTPSDGSLAIELRGQLEQFSTQASAFTYAREYAVVLSNLGRSEEAINVLVEQRLNNKELSILQREQLLLLMGVIAGVDSQRGTEALQQLLRNGKTKETMRLALQLLAGDPAALSNGLTEFLDQMVALAEPHPLLGEMYYIRSQLSLARAEAALSLDPPNLELAESETAKAVKDAEFLLEQFPGLQQITNVYRLLAYAAVQRKPAQYRAAADFLIQLRDQTENASDRALLNRLIGDCYFLNRDFDNAVDFYDAAYTRSFEDDADDGLFLRLVTAEVRSGQIQSAIRHIDEADFSGRVSTADRWRSEWNVAQALMEQGQLETALTRVRLLFESIDSTKVPTVLEFRLGWLELYLTHLAGGSGVLLQDVEMLLARVEAVPVGKLEEYEAQLLITELILLQAQVLIQSGASNEAVAALERLRVGYAGSSAAQRSYLTEADYYASINDFQAAQETLTKLATTYPNSELAPQALFEAALYCERRGADFYEEAVLLHDKIAEDYAADPLVYSARLKQGDLLRKMNNFAGAQIIYENLINVAPTHPRRYIPQLSRVDCMLALAKNGKAQLDDVVLSLEELLDIPNLPVDFQAEVGYKWGFALNKRNEPEKAKEIFTIISSRFLLDGEQAVQLGASGRYWMARTMLALGGLLEDSAELAEARRVYRKMVAFNLPGRNLALDRVNTIQVVDETVSQ
ncbi:MAG: tetratricopeptide repeat protein [Lentimonas sp.]